VRQLARAQELCAVSGVGSAYPPCRRTKQTIQPEHISTIAQGNNVEPLPLRAWRQVLVPACLTISRLSEQSSRVLAPLDIECHYFWNAKHK
jgi:hypothetical protein